MSIEILTKAQDLLILDPKQKINWNSIGALNGKEKIATVVILTTSSILSAVAATVATVFALYIVAVVCATVCVIIAVSAIVASRIQPSKDLFALIKKLIPSKPPEQDQVQKANKPIVSALPRNSERSLSSSKKPKQTGTQKISSKEVPKGKKKSENRLDDQQENESSDPLSNTKIMSEKPGINEALDAVEEDISKKADDKNIALLNPLPILKEKTVIQPGQVIQTSNKSAVSQEEAVKQPTQIQPIHDEIAYKTGIDYFLKGQYLSALPQFQKLADTKYAPSYLYLAMIYQEAIGLDRNESKKWFDEAGKEFAWFLDEVRISQDKDAQYHLALCYMRGCGINKNITEATNLLKLAAEKDHVVAQKDLGQYYSEGENKDTEQALFWLEKAAEQNFVNAQDLLGVHYYKHKDYKKAVKWFLKAAEQGLANAQNYLGFCYSKQQGVEKNKKKAAEMFELAANQGYAPAQCNLGNCYYYGLGVNEDKIKAKELWEWAAKNGDATARDALEKNFKKQTG